MTSISRHKILVVDDDPDILNFIKHQFASVPVELITCSTVEKALDELGHEVFTLAIVDIVMGQGISSEKVIKFVKEDFAGANRDLPVAVMSAHMNENYAKKLRLKGSNVFATLKKPLQSKGLSDEILGIGIRSILLVEDDHDMVSLMKSELEQGDFQVFSCSHVDLAQRVVDLVSIDLMVVDNKLGVGKDSREFIEYIKKYHRGIPTILSGKDIPEDLQNSESLNLVGLLNKPVKRGSLLQQISEYFTKRESLASESIHISGNGEGNIKEGHTVVLGENPEDRGEEYTRVTGGPIEDHGEELSRVESNESGIISEELTVVSGGKRDESDEFLKVKSISHNFDDNDSINQDKGDINHRNKNGQTPLMIFCYLGDLQKVKAVLKDGADINLKSKNGKTCLHYAAFSGNPELLTYLVQYQGMRINDRDSNGCTPMFDAIKSGDLSMVRSCVELGARLTFFLEGRSYLTFAILYGHADIAKYLLDLGLDKNKKDYKSQSPLDYALKSGVKEIIEVMRPK